MIQLLSKIVLALFTTLLFAAVIGFFYAWNQTHREYSHFSERLAEQESKLTSIRTEREAKEEYLRQFLNDPAVVERAVRERLGYVGPDETIFRYETW